MSDSVFSQPILSLTFASIPYAEMYSGHTCPVWAVLLIRVYKSLLGRNCVEQLKLPCMHRTLFASYTYFNVLLAEEYARPLLIPQRVELSSSLELSPYQHLPVWYHKRIRHQCNVKNWIRRLRYQNAIPCRIFIPKSSPPILPWFFNLRRTLSPIRIVSTDKLNAKNKSC